MRLCPATLCLCWVAASSQSMRRYSVRGKHCATSTSDLVREHLFPVGSWSSSTSSTHASSWWTPSYEAASDGYSNIGGWNQATGRDDAWSCINLIERLAEFAPKARKKRVRVLWFQQLNLCVCAKVSFNWVWAVFGENTSGNLSKICHKFKKGMEIVEKVKKAARKTSKIHKNSKNIKNVQKSITTYYFLRKLLENLCFILKNYQKRDCGGGAGNSLSTRDGPKMVAFLGPWVVLGVTPLKLIQESVSFGMLWILYRCPWQLHVSAFLM